MTTTTSATPHRKAIIGNRSNAWLHSSQSGFDLTHPASPTTPYAESKVTIQTSHSPITIATSKSALIIVDMQNFFLSPVFGRKRGPGHMACDQLIKHAIPAARKAGIRIIWLNWGLTDKDMETMPPAVQRAFGFSAIPVETPYPEHNKPLASHPASINVDRFGQERPHQTTSRGLGVDCGQTEYEGKLINIGKVLMRDSWNAALYPPLDSIYTEGTILSHKPDVWIHKNRMSGMWGASTDLQAFLEKEGICTLFFTGVNTDQCVGGTLTDAFSKGYDCVLLGDGCGTSSPEHAQLCWEFNAARTFGFATSCEEFAKGVERMEGGSVV